MKGYLGAGSPAGRFVDPKRGTSEQAVGWTKDREKLTEKRRAVIRSMGLSLISNGANQTRAKRQAKKIWVRTGHCSVMLTDTWAVLPLALPLFRHGRLSRAETRGISSTDCSSPLVSQACAREEDTCGDGAKLQASLSTSSCPPFLDAETSDQGCIFVTRNLKLAAWAWILVVKRARRISPRWFR